MTSKQILIIVIATFITALIWVTSDIYHSRKQVTTSPEVQQLLEPIDPNFDKQAVDRL